MYTFKTLNLENITRQYGIKDIELSKMNIFVGSNNSGKSRFIRSFLNLKNTEYNFKNNNFLKLTKIEEEKAEKIGVLLREKEFQKLNGGEYFFNDYIQLGKKYFDNVNYFKNQMEKMNDRRITISRGSSITSFPMSSVILEMKKHLDKIQIEKDPGEIDLVKRYIPVLRGMRKIGDSDFYKRRTINDYFLGENTIPTGAEEEHFKKVKNLEIITGLELYQKCKDMLLGSSNDRKNIERFQKFLSHEFFEGEEILLMPKQEDEDVHIKIGNDQDHPISQLGDGVQSMIVLTFPLFENSGKHMLVGIEEPEIYLHPGAQRKLMEVLLDKERKYGFENFQYLITTHSNHFLDLTLDYPEDVIVYESSKIDDSKFEITRKNDENMLGLMESLGVRNSSVFLANCTIWVEGITDRYYLKEYFKVFQENLPEDKKRFEEDRHYSFVEYSGGNITHWDFLDEDEGMVSSQISNNIFLLADTDGYRNKVDDDGELLKKAERIKRLEEKLGEKFYALEAKEIESILTPEVLKKVVLYKEMNNGKVDQKKLKAIGFIQEDYKNEGIGKYITEMLKSKEIVNHRKYNTKSGTIHEKVKFCRIACDNIKGMSDLSKEAKVICEKLYNFIAEANGEVHLRSTSQADEALSEEIS